MPPDPPRRRSESNVDGRPNKTTEKFKSRGSATRLSATYADNTKLTLGMQRTRRRIKDLRYVIGSVILISVLGGTGVGIYYGVSKTADVQTTVTPTSPVTEFTGVRQESSPPSTTTPPSALQIPEMDEETWLRVRGYCGRPVNRPSLSRIIGGSEAVKHSWPWQAGVLRYKGYSDGRSTVEHLCGGTIVGPTFVITATHCFLSSRRDRIINNVQSFRVLVGGHVKESKSDGAKYFEIANIRHHPKNNLVTFMQTRTLPVHDISVIVLKTAIDPTAISPIADFACLPRPGTIPPIGKKCWTTGWGATYGTGSDWKLKQVSQPIVSEYTCQKKYGSYRISKENHLCAGPYNGAQGTCQGDSGGPLVCQYEDGTWVLHGDTSFGPKPCGTSPSVWAQVSYQLDWVCCVLKDHGPCKEIGCLLNDQ